MVSGMARAPIGNDSASGGFKMRGIVGATAAMQTGRYFVKASGNYRTEIIGRKPKEVGEEPEAFLIEMPAANTILPHFHQVDQYQIFVEGSGLLGRNTIS